MRQYYEVVGEDLDRTLPLTFHIKTADDLENSKFKEYYLSLPSEDKNIWIIKPGENTNRG